MEQLVRSGDERNERALQVLSEKLDDSIEIGHVSCNSKLVSPASDVPFVNHHAAVQLYRTLAHKLTKFYPHVMGLKLSVKA